MGLKLQKMLPRAGYWFGNVVCLAKRPDQEWKVRETVLSKVRNRRSITSKKGSKSAGRVDLTGNLSSTKDVLLVIAVGSLPRGGLFINTLKCNLCH